MARRRSSASSPTRRHDPRAAARGGWRRAPDTPTATPRGGDSRGATRAAGCDRRCPAARWQRRSRDARPRGWPRHGQILSLPPAREANPPELARLTSPAHARPDIGGALKISVRVWTLEGPVRPGTSDRHGHALLLSGIARRAHDVEEEGATVRAEAGSRELGSVQPIAREVEDAAVTREAANELFPD